MNTRLTIALDAMGGDNAPGQIVAGGEQAARELGVEVVLVGRPEAIGDTELEVVAASEVIDMADDPARSVRVMKDSSLVRGAELVRDGAAAAFVSAGNTGAMVAASLLKMGRIKGVARPAVATAIPVPGSTPTVLLDSGAIADCQAQWLVQFAQMGSAFATRRFGYENPRVGLLSIGEEKSKGNELVKETHGLLAQLDGINFIGNVEGRDVMSDIVDVVVTDGFTGNVVLKTLEGGLKSMVSAVFGALTGPDAGDEAAAAIGLLAPLATELNPDTYGGAMLLGVDGVSIIGHGSSGATAIYNAIAVARDMAAADLVSAMRASIGR
ncbi:MAG: phosphate acyltransferase PlsX [Acidimicrobiales bacterium]|nr:phosphate acyltransferase PlsX [Acidimicrobiales bacterium]